ncbi:hypothetical protein GGR56DRAFT_677058 [Xylariaceae sp. FL0804]|nr:hypothetical protein GGR56DRAFT_677058 [Xylariaceae sp. FL0804]
MSAREQPQGDPQEQPEEDLHEQSEEDSQEQPQKDSQEQSQKNTDEQPQKGVHQQLDEDLWEKSEKTYYQKQQTDGILEQIYGDFYKEEPLDDPLADPLSGPHDDEPVTPLPYDSISPPPPSVTPSSSSRSSAHASPAATAATDAATDAADDDDEDQLTARRMDAWFEQCDAAMRRSDKAVSRSIAAFGRAMGHGLKPPELLRQFKMLRPGAVPRWIKFAGERAALAEDWARAADAWVQEAERVTDAALDRRLLESEAGSPSRGPCPWAEAAVVRGPDARASWVGYQKIWREEARRWPIIRERYERLAKGHLAMQSPGDLGHF